MANEVKWKTFFKKMIPKIVKASVIAVVLYFLLFYVPSVMMSGFIPSEYMSSVEIFAAVTIFFTFITQLASGTIFQYVFGAIRAFVFMIFFAQTLSSGLITGNFGPVSFAVDFRIFFGMLIAIELLDFGKSVFEAVNFISEKVETYDLPTVKH